MAPLFADVSELQGSIGFGAYYNWAKQWDGRARILMRSSQGVGDPDALFEQYWSTARAVGIDCIGIYHYAYPNLHPGSAGAQQEADYFASVVGNRLGPNDWLMLDLEQNEQGSWALAFGQRLWAYYPQTPIWLYDSLSHIQTYFIDPALAALFLLNVADWTLDPNARPICPAPWASYVSVQFSDKYDVPGIGPCDCNVWLGAPAPAPAKGTHSDMAILQHPVDNGRLDIVWIQNSDGRILHAHNHSDGMAGLFTEASGADFGIPPEPAVEVQASFSNNGQSINCIVIGQSGQWYGRSFNTGDNSPQNSWTALHGVTSRLPVAAAGEPIAQKIAAALQGASKALETGLA